MQQDAELKNEKSLFNKFPELALTRNFLTRRSKFYRSVFFSKLENIFNRDKGFTGSRTISKIVFDDE